MNKVMIEIDNCLDCPHSFRDKIYTPDPWDHEDGCFCKKVEEDNEKSKRFHGSKFKLVASDDWNLRKWSWIPDWCPLLNKENE